MNKYGIFRILGNELPPRDLPGSKLRILNFILQQESAHPRTEKWWLVNHICDDLVRQQTCAALQHHRAHYLYLPFDKNTYDKTPMRAKPLAAIPINKARNLAIEFGRGRFDYFAVLDGDCYFPADSWHRAVEEMEAHPSPYYSLPMLRSTLELELQGKIPELLDEPQLIFHKEAELRFDEALPWNSGDKLNLLRQVGHYDQASTWHLLQRTDQCRLAGVVHHLASGPPEFELEPDPVKRSNALLQLRREALSLLLSRLSSFYIPA